MLYAHFSRYFLCFVCIVSVMCSGCATWHGMVSHSDGDREASWEEFTGTRPEPRYVRFQNRDLTMLCADITSYYIGATTLLDRAIRRIENSDVGTKLEKIRAEQGEEAFIDALRGLTREERRSYRLYMKSERSDLAVVGGYMQAISCGFTATMLFPYTFMYGPHVARKANLVLEQYEYAVKSLNWLCEYEALLERAQEYVGR